MARHTAYFGHVWNATLVPSPVPEKRGELHVVEHLVGFTQITLSNGDVMKMHLHVDSIEFDETKQEMTPRFRVIPEVLVRRADYTPRFGLTKRELT